MSVSMPQLSAGFLSRVYLGGFFELCVYGGTWFVQFSSFFSLFLHGEDLLHTKSDYILSKVVECNGMC